MKKLILSICLLFALSSMAQQPIDRKKVVERNNPHVTTMDSLNSLSVGNGGFAMTVDGTGLQSFLSPILTVFHWNHERLGLAFFCQS